MITVCYSLVRTIKLLQETVIHSKFQQTVKNSMWFELKILQSDCLVRTVQNNREQYSTDLVMLMILIPRQYVHC